MARLVLDSVSKVFRSPKGTEVQAVRDLSLTVEDRDLVVLVGPSGSGKTTTLRMIAGLEDVSHGTIAIDGRLVNRLEPKDRDVAMVSQNYALFPHMTALENLGFGLRLRRLPKAEIERRVEEAAQLLGLAGLLDRLPKALSGGQRQRVAVGRALVQQPRAFLFDEPLSSLDAPMRLQLRLDIKRLHKRLAATMLYVTHDQVEAMTMGDRLVVMKDGAVQQIADPLTVYRQPANLFVAGFMGSPPMNFFRGEICRAGETLTFSLALGDGERFAAPLGPQQKPVATDYIGREAVLGARPEDFVLSECSGAPPATGAWRARVELVEPMGPETFVHLAMAEKAVVCRCHPVKVPAVGTTVYVQVDMDRAHLFDALTEKALA